MQRPPNIPADYQLFKLGNGESKWLPPWSNEPLRFKRQPDRALRLGARKIALKGKRKGK